MAGIALPEGALVPVAVEVLKVVLRVLGRLSPSRVCCGRFPVLTVRETVGRAVGDGGSLSGPGLVLVKFCGSRRERRSGRRRLRQPRRLAWLLRRRRRRPGRRHGSGAERGSDIPQKHARGNWTDRRTISANHGPRTRQPATFSGRPQIRAPPDVPLPPGPSVRPSADQDDGVLKLLRKGRGRRNPRSN